MNSKCKKIRAVSDLVVVGSTGHSLLVGFKDIYIYTFQRPTMVGFLDLKATFDSVYWEVLRQCLLLKSVSRKYIKLMKTPYWDGTNRVRTYGELSSKHVTSSGVRQHCWVSPFSFNFIIDLLLTIASGLTGVNTWTEDTEWSSWARWPLYLSWKSYQIQGVGTWQNLNILQKLTWLLPTYVT